MTIQLPIIRRVTVSGYELYPGRDGDGIDWAIPKGVSVIAGVNGLGKTTFLNILFRLLAGPADWRAEDGGDIGNLDHTLRPLRDLSFFRARVRDGAASALATAEFLFGRRCIRVRRRLKDLAIVHLTVDDQERPATEAAYLAAIREVSGLATDFDFHLVLRLLVFYLEDRRALIWDRTAQDEVLRALFYPAEEAARVSALSDKVQSLDSQFRNQRVHLKRQEKELADAEAAVAADQASRTRYNSTQTRLRALQERSAEIDRQLAGADGERVQARRRVERAKLQHEELRREHQDLRQRFFASLFPGIGDVGTYVLVNLDSGAGCMVCGNKAQEAAARLEQCAAVGICPLCDAPPSRQDVRPIRTPAAEARKLQDLERRRDAADEERHAFLAALELANARYWEIFESQVGISEQRDERERELELLRQTLPPPDDQMEAMRRLVADLRRKQNLLRARREQEEVKLRADIEVGRKAVRAVAQSIANRFKRNAAAFLAERCEVVVVEEDRQFGSETGKFAMPRFTVKMTSGVFKHQPQPRRDDHEVSESQKEFIDLAFRLALIEEASGSRPAMMVIETPEASLDSLFIFRAGHLLARFANGGGAIGNRLIASSNLNKEDMIPALFGLAPEEDYIAWWRRRRTGAPAASVGAVPLAERPARVLNLLAEAAENKAVEQHRTGYELRYTRALDPDWSRPPPKASRP